jgi:hypothetical protein
MMRLQRFPAEQSLRPSLAEWGLDAAHPAPQQRGRARARCLGWATIMWLALAPAAALAAPLLQTQEPDRDTAKPAAAAGDTAGGWNSSSETSADLVRRLLGMSSSDELGLDAAAMESALQLDPAEAGLQAVAQTLRDSATLRQVLGSAAALREDDAGSAARGPGPGNAVEADAINGGDPRLGLSGAGAGGPGAAAVSGAVTGERNRGSAQSRAQPQQQPDGMLDAGLVQDEGPSLRTVLRSYARVRRGDERQRSHSAAQSISDAAEDVADDGLSLGERLLDSRMLGDAIQALVTRPAAYQLDNSFSVLGYGRFEMELDLTSDLGGVTVSEHTTGVSLSVPLEAKPPSDADQPPPQLRSDRVDPMIVLLNFLHSETGITLMIISVVLLVVLGMFKFAMGLRR